MANRPRTLNQWLMFTLAVAIAVAVIFRVPQIRAFVTGGA